MSAAGLGPESSARALRAAARRGKRLAAGGVATTLLCAVLPFGVGVAEAAWSARTGTGGSLAVARTMVPGQQPLVATTPSTGNTVIVSWEPSTGGPVQGYQVRSYDAVTGTPRPVGGDCSLLLTDTSCTDVGVPDGEWAYSVTVRQDAWTGTESSVSSPTWVDTVAPTASLTFPANGAAYNQTGWALGCASPGACGSVSDGGSGLAAEGLIVQQVATGLYWDGAAFASANEELLPVTRVVSGTDEWGFRVANFSVDGLYTVRLVATDLVGNTTEDSATFTIDHTPPPSPLGFPVDDAVYGVDLWNAGCQTPGFCGTVADPGGGIMSTTWSVRRIAGGLYWSGAAFTSSSEVLAAATDPAGIPFPILNFPSDGYYTVRVVLTDAAGNTSSSSVTFLVDTAGPMLTQAFPPPGGTFDTQSWNAGCAQPGICGTAVDPGGILISSLVSVRHVDSGLYWDGSAFTSVAEQQLDFSTGLTPFPTSNFAVDGRYVVHILIRDEAGNAASVSDAFVIDRAAPAVNLTFPVNGSFFNTNTWNAGCAVPGVCGTTSDTTSGVASSVASIRRGSGDYWNGTGFTSPSEVLISVIGDETLPFSASLFPDDGTYTVRLRSVDFAGNAATTQSTFTFDRTGPTVGLTFPVDGGSYNSARWGAGCPTPGICSTFTDAASGVASNRASIRRASTGLYWNGTAFASVAEMFTTFATSSGLPFAIANFAADGAYTVNVVGTDHAGNTATTQAAFTIDRVAPAFAFTFPVNAATYNTARWDAGCPTAGLCGAISDTGSSLAAGSVSIRQGTDNYWNGTAFTSPTEVLLPFSGSLAFAASNFPTDTTYTVRGTTTDPAGNTTAISNTFMVDRTGPTITALTETNANGLLATGDAYSITYSEPIDLSTLCTTWIGNTNQMLTNATVTMTNNGSNDTVSAVTSPTCTLRLGTLATGINYVSSNVTFTTSTITWTEATRTLRITIGTRVTGTIGASAQSARTSTYVPGSPVTDRGGNTLTTTTFPATNVRF